MLFCGFALLDGDDFDFNESVLGQTGNFHCAAGRIVAFGEEGCIYRIHCSKVVHVAQEHGGLNNGIHRQASGLQNRLDVGQRLLGLTLNAFGECAGSGVDGQLTGSDDQIAQIDSLAVGADGSGGIGSADDSLRGNAPPFLIIVYILPEFSQFCKEQFLSPMQIV